ncbi:MAG TPA: S41 family peptidase [Streptosporangiaceae bacterium]|nr:S41 family peptidase [Streptosporangiaceae bacterium]
MTSAGYLRFPHIQSDLIAFVAADDVWLAPSAGGRAWRFTTDQATARWPRLSPGGGHVAYVSSKDGGPEVYVANADDGATQRLTHWGSRMAKVGGWTGDGEVLAISPAGQPFVDHMRARVLGTDLSGGLGAERILPFGPVSDISAGNARTALLTGTWGQDMAHWKRYRGGTAGRLWVGEGLDAGAASTFRRLLADIGGQLGSPMIVGDRVAFLSDFEGTGNVYSVAADGTGLRRHTDHDGWYARQASTDGRRVIYACGGELWLLDGLDADPVRLDIMLGTPVSGRAPRLITAADHVGSLSVDKSGRASAVEVRGTVHWLTHRDGPARALAAVPGARARFPQVLGTAGDVVWATDEDGTDALAIGSAPGAGSVTARRLAAGQVGRVQSLAAAPDGSAVAVSAQDGHLWLVDVASGQVRELGASANGAINGLAWSPDSAWLAWSEPTDHPADPGGLALRKLRLARVADGEVTDATDGRFIDTDPVFSLDGKYLAFLSRRSFDPIYDAHFFDLSFPYGARPYLLPLQAAAPSPFGPELAGRPSGGEDTKADDTRADDSSAGQGDGVKDSRDKGGGGIAPVVVDTADLAGRVVTLPVQEARYARLRPVKGGLAWLREPVKGELGLGGAAPDGDAPRPSLEHFDFARRAVTELASEADWFEASGDGTKLVISDHGKLTVVPADRKADPDNADDKIVIDRSRARFSADPPALWQQAYGEAFRIMQHDYWVADMADVDWDGVREEYRPLLDRIASQDDFTDLLWEVFGELGTSHAYAFGPGGDHQNAGSVPGVLGADLERDGDTWRVTRTVLGDASDPRARAPLAAPGAGVTAGDAILAVDGRPVGAHGPGPLLLGTAGKPVALTIGPADGGEPRQVAVVPLRSDLRLRYLDWVRHKRTRVHELSGGRAGYVHVPDMVSEGWADFLRDLRSEMLRDAVIVDIRGNGGGHTSELVIEKLNRHVIGWDNRRGMQPGTYPDGAPRGPIVALADEFAGSDGDIVTRAIQALQLGPVVGARTWGGVIGYDDYHELVEGTKMTVPRLSFWFESGGWGVENYGVDPDVEILMSPADWAADRDTQLETAVRLALAALEERPAARPPDVTTRPSRRRPPLPPRAGRPTTAT